MHVFSADTDLTDAPKVTKVTGFHITETAGAAASVKLRNGSATGTVFVDVRLPAVVGGNSIHFAADRPLIFNKGLYVDVVTGTVTGTIVPS
jgi:hypothetical protein